MLPPTASDFDPVTVLAAAEREAETMHLRRADETDDAFRARLRALLAEERADADEAVSGYLQTSEGHQCSATSEDAGHVRARVGGEHATSLPVDAPQEPACRSLAGPGSDSKSDAAGFDPRGRRCNLKTEMAAPDGLPREKPAMRPGDREDRALVCPMCRVISGKLVLVVEDRCPVCSMTYWLSEAR